MRRRAIVGLTLLLALTTLMRAAARGGPSSTQPAEGLHQNTPGVHALVGARIVVAPAEVIEKGTLVVRDGVIAAVGPDAAVPPDARRWPLEGKTIYPGLIDAYSPISLDPAPTARGAPYWNPQVQPEREAARAYRADASLNAAFRSQGVTCRLVVPDSGVIGGTSALVTTGDGPGARVVVKPQVALHMRLTIDRDAPDRKSYPNSPMGALALARQAMYDAQWYARAWQAYASDPGLPRPEQNNALERLHRITDEGTLMVFEAGDEQDFFRADRFAREFALKIAVRGSGREYCRLEAIRQTGRPVIVPLAFPKPPQVGTPEAAVNVSLDELMHWDIAPENPARLAAAGVPIAFCTDGLKSPKELLGAVRTAVARGLGAEAALRALTTQPARLFGASERLGTLEAGKAAHLVVTDGDLFQEKTQVLETWVDGVRYELAPAAVVDLRGCWRVTPADRPQKRFILALAGKPDKLEGTASLEEEKKSQKDEGPKEVEKTEEHAKAEAKPQELPQPAKLKLVGLRDARFSCALEGKLLEVEGVVRLSAVVSKSPDGKISWLGNVHWPEGTSAPIRVEPIEAPPAAEAGAKPEPPKSRPASFPVNYPLGAFGRAAPPHQPPLLAFTGATVWTCEDPGVLEDATVVIGEGRIIAVGRGLIIPPGAVVVDCKGKHITPGIIDCHSHMATDGGVNESAQAVSAEVRIGDFLDARDPAIYQQLAGGVTASHVLHGSSNPIGGQNQLIKLRWGALPEELKFAEAPPTIKFALGENVKQSNWGDQFTTRYPQTRMGVVEIIRDALQAAREYARQWDEWRSARRGLPPRRDLELEALVEVLQGRRLIHCHAYRQDEVIALLGVLDEFGVRAAALQHILEGYKVADAIARHGAGASAFSDWWAYKFEVYDAIPYNGPIMHRAGVLVSFNSDSRELARHLNQEAAKAIKYGGLAPEEALKLVTLNPARQLRVDQYVGSLRPGKHADLVVWSGPPLSNLSRPEQTWVDGRKYFDLQEDRALRQEASRRHAALVQKVLASGQEMRKPEEKDANPDDWRPL